MHDPIYLPLGTNGRINWLSGHGGSNVMMGGTFHVKRFSFKGIYGLHYHNKLDKKAQK